MSFQWIIDNAVDVTVNKRGVVAQTVARDQTVRAVSRGGRIWRFEVTPSPGSKWEVARPYIEELDKLDRFTTSTISFSKSGQEWLFGYRGTTPPVGATATVTQGSATATLSAGAFAPGDIIQLTGGKVYAITNSVSNGGSVTLHRPVLEASNTYNISAIGKNCVWSVICTNMPTYKITPNGLVEWSGTFTFVEALA